MTRDRANEVLFLWKVGAELFPPSVINSALYVTGDLDGPNSEAGARLVRTPCPATWLESAGVAFGARTGEGAPGRVLEAAGIVDGGNAA
jgi:hypothetical protein